MGRACPEELQVVLEVLVGLRWPDADEDALYAAAEQWDRLGDAVGAARDHLRPAAAAQYAGDRGATRDEFGRSWDGLSTRLIPRQVALCDGLATSLREFAGDVESTKQFIVIQLGILAAEIGLGIAGTVLTFGVSDVVAEGAVALTRLAIRRACAEMVENVATTAARLGVKGMVDGLLNDSLLQGLRHWNGGRPFDPTELAGAAAGGGVGGLVGGHLAAGAAGLGNVGARTAGHVVAGVAGNDALLLTQSSITGQPFHPGQLLGGAGRGVLAAGRSGPTAAGGGFLDPGASPGSSELLPTTRIAPDGTADPAPGGTRDDVAAQADPVTPGGPARPDPAAAPGAGPE